MLRLGYEPPLSKTTLIFRLTEMFTQGQFEIAINPITIYLLPRQDGVNLSTSNFSTYLAYTPLYRLQYLLHLIEKY